MKDNFLVLVTDVETAQYKRWAFLFPFYLLGHVYVPGSLDMEYALQETENPKMSCFWKQVSWCQFQSTL